MSEQYEGGTSGTKREGQLYSFGEYLRILRKDKNWTLKEGAKRMGMPVQKLCDIESGRRYHKRVSVELVHKASEAYGIPISDIFACVRSSLHVSQTTEEILGELLPLVRLTDMISERLKRETASYPQDVEELATEVHSNILKIQVLCKLIQKRTIKLENSEKITGES